MTPGELKSLIHGAGEIAVLDVREHGEYGEGHPFYATSCPYSRLEIRIGDLVPSRNTRLVLIDGDDGVAERAGRRLAGLGYAAIDILEGGIAAWTAAGFTAFKGVNVPSKTFGELMEAANHPPSVTAEELAQWRQEGRALSVFDGRPFGEFRTMSIPGARCVPNGEALYRWSRLVGDPDRIVVINCAGRTRGLIGVQSLRMAGVPNPIYALSNGTQGWALAGLPLDRGCVSDPLPPPDPRTADQWASRFPCPGASLAQVEAWRSDQSRTCYLLDVRTRDEFIAGRLAGSVHAPAGQLVQATDQWVAVRRARIVLADDNGVRSRFAGFWLRRMGHEAYVLEDPIEAGACERGDPIAPAISCDARTVALAPLAAKSGIEDGSLLAIDLRPSRAFREAAVPGSLWSIRPRVPGLIAGHSGPILFIADDAAVAALAAGDAFDAGHEALHRLDGGLAAWRAAGLPVLSRPGQPADADAIDHLFFVHDRHHGNLDASRRYLAWEQQLVDQIDADERAAFEPALSGGRP